MQTSYGRHDHEDGTAIVLACVRDRMVHWSAAAAPAPPRTARRTVTYRAAVARWPTARITLRQGARIIHENKRVVIDAPGSMTTEI